MFESAAFKEFATLFRARAKPPASGPPPDGAGAAVSAGRAGTEQHDHIGQPVPSTWARSSMIVSRARRPLI
eukprot:5933335-Pyramimonas_sp.AAC.1